MPPSILIQLCDQSDTLSSHSCLFHVDSSCRPKDSDVNTARSKLCVSVLRRASDVFWMNYPRPWTEHTNGRYSGSISRHGNTRIAYSSTSSYPSANFASRNLPSLAFFVSTHGETTLGFNVCWRPDSEDPEEFILPTCSTLLAIVDVRGKKQFSHFSERIINIRSHRKFGTSFPLSRSPQTGACSSRQSVSRRPLQLNYSIDETKIQNFPLAWYSAEHWVNHARIEGVSSDIRDGLDCLFDKNKPHLAAWTWLNDVEAETIPSFSSSNTA